MDIRDIIARLSASAGPSGYETGAVSAAAELLAPCVDEIHTDTMGNLIAVKRCGKPGAPKVMLDAHLDEVGMIVTDHEGGFLKFASIGVDPRILPGLRVRVCADSPIIGVITCLPPHVTDPDDRDKAFPIEELRVDCGLSESEARELVPVGTRIVYGTEPFFMGDKTVCGKSLDDRACFVILCRVMDLLKDENLPVDVCVLGSVQEEYTAAGASTSAYSMQPTEAIVVDVSFAETPDSKEYCKPLGSGPMIGVGPVMNRRISKRLQALAKELEIPFTREVLPSWTGTNADEIQISREGVAVCCVSLPLRYMHTPIEAVDLDDIEHCRLYPDLEGGRLMLLDTLKALCPLFGPSGLEDEVRAYIRKEAEPYADRIVETPTGALLVFRQGKKKPKFTVMLAAHMDEVGVIVREIGCDGFLKFGCVGGIDRRVILGKSVFLGGKRVRGVIGMKPIHLTTQEERKSVPKVKELYIDIGARSKEEAEALVEEGEFGCFDPEFLELRGGFVCSKAIDDRLGCALMLEKLKEELPVDTWFAFTVQEEIGSKGALGAAFEIRTRGRFTTPACSACCAGSQRKREFPGRSRPEWSAPRMRGPPFRPPAAAGLPDSPPRSAIFTAHPAWAMCGISKP